MENENNDLPIPIPPKKKKRRKKIVIVIILLVALLFLASVVLASLNTARKPALYLYPTTDSTINVNLDVNGYIYNDIPKYDDGWEVFVTKEGIIESKYDYLFYEVKLFKTDVPEEGWVVEYGRLEEWFLSNLPKLGLNKKETEQFMDYWIQELPQANYYEVKLLDKTFLDKNITLNISPQPDTVIRLMFYFTPLEEAINISAPEIITPKREGFTAVEWGGILDD